MTRSASASSKRASPLRSVGLLPVAEHCGHTGTFAGAGSRDGSVFYGDGQSPRRRAESLSDAEAMGVGRSAALPFGASGASPSRPSTVRDANADVETGVAISNGVRGSEAGSGCDEGRDPDLPASIPATADSISVVTYVPQLHGSLFSGGTYPGGSVVSGQGEAGNSGTSAASGSGSDAPVTPSPSLWGIGARPGSRADAGDGTS